MPLHDGNMISIHEQNPVEESLHPFAVSVLIVSYNARDDLIASLPTLIDLARDISVETIVVDNHSSDGSREILTEYSDRIITIFNPDNVGFACAVNQGARQARGRYLLLLNPDARIMAKALGKLIDYLSSHSDAGAVAPRIVNPDGSLQPSRGSFPNLPRSLVHLAALKRLMPRDEWIQKYAGRFLGRCFRQYSKPKQEEDVDYTTGACVLLRREVFEQLEGMDESFFLYYEEIDFALRMRASGYRWVYLHDASVLHSIAASSGLAPLRPFYERNRSLLHYYRKHKPLWQGLSIYTALILAATIRWCLIALSPRFQIDRTKTKAEEKAVIRSIFGLYKSLSESDHKLT